MADEVAGEVLPSEGFGPFEGRVWLNTAHQGALPRSAAEAAHTAVALKQSPSKISNSMFFDVPTQLRTSLARLLGAVPEEVVLANSASYGLHLLANGIPWREGDEVLLVEGDFPATILPWLALDQRGVGIRRLQVEPGRVPTASQLVGALGRRTRVFCTSWVNSFSGETADVDALGEVCRTNGTRLVVNATQAAGARPLELARRPVDALVSSGFKWLCGPYATGLLWLRPDVLDMLEYNQAYWLALQEQGELLLGTDSAAQSRPRRSVRTYDVFCPANFLNFMPWNAAVELLNRIGPGRIAAYDQDLVTRLIEGLDRSKYEIVSPAAAGPSRSTLVVLTHRRRERNPDIHRTLADGGVDIALRDGNLRLSPHLYNTNTDIDTALDLLNQAA